MKSKIWPQWPRKWPLDLNNLRRGWVNFFKISASSFEKWAIARFSSKTFKFSHLCYFLLASENRELKNIQNSTLNSSFDALSKWHDPDKSWNHLHSWKTWTAISTIEINLRKNSFFQRVQKEEWSTFVPGEFEKFWFWQERWRWKSGALSNLPKIIR